MIRGDGVGGVSSSEHGKYGGLTRGDIGLTRGDSGLTRGDSGLFLRELVRLPVHGDKQSHMTVHVQCI